MDLVLIGLGLGLAAGVSPGPLLTLVVSSTLARGFGAGLRVAAAPLLTDAPIILLAILVLRDLSSAWLGLIGTLGGCVVIYLGIATLRSPFEDRAIQDETGGSAADLWRGAIVNLLNPHPWIFWITVQGPLLIRGWRQSPITGTAFVLAFYAAIVGCKVAIAWLVARGRHALNDRWYRRLLIGCGVLLTGMGAFLVFQAISGDAWACS
jgi:threonine/homoserine/homoserine lactone efflux protein